MRDPYKPTHEMIERLIPSVGRPSGVYDHSGKEYDDPYRRLLPSIGPYWPSWSAAIIALVAVVGVAAWWWWR